MTAPAAPAMPIHSIESEALWPLLLSGATNVVIAIIILIVGWLVSRWAYRLTHDGLERARFVDPTLKPLMANIARYAVIAVTVVAVLQQFGVQTTSLIAVLGAAGLALGLAIQGTLSNVASGVMLLALRPVRAGELVLIAGISGTIREVGLFRTVMISSNGEYISVPNATIFSNTVVNQTREPLRRAEFKVSIDSAADIEHAQQLALSVLHADNRVLKTPPPAVVVDSLDDTAVKLSVQAWTANANFNGVMSDLQKNVRGRLVAEGITPPQQIVSYVRRGDGRGRDDIREVRSPRTN